MPRFRQIRKYGDTWIIKLNPSDIKDFQLQENQEVDVEECFKTQKPQFSNPEPSIKKKLDSQSRGGK